MAGNNVRRNFEGMARDCSQCSTAIVVTAKMVERSKYVCGPCESRRSVEWARRNREKKRASNQRHQARITDKRAGRTRAYREQHPEKRAAHQAVQTALRNGTLARCPCSVCGQPRAHAHHDDYGKPLDVIWLCHAHHMERHHALDATRINQGERE